jgi:hypothetical protein
MKVRKFTRHPSPEDATHIVQFVLLAAFLIAMTVIGPALFH